MTVSPEIWRILRKRGVIATSEEQARPVGRADLLEIIEENGGSAQYLFLDGLDFSGADLRGLDLSNAFFQGCNFSNINATPLVKVLGKELSPHDLAIPGILDQWDSGQLDPRFEVIRTRMKDSFLTAANLDGAVFASADMQGTFINQAYAERVMFLKADLSNTSFRLARFTGMDLRYARLCDADLYSFHLETNLLDDVDWGEKQIVLQEKQEKWDEAISVYVTLSRVHEIAGMSDLAGEFRYRSQQARSARVLEKGLSQARILRERGTVRHWLSAIRHGGGRNLVEWLRRWSVNFISGYGERPWRVVRVISLSLIGFSFIYFDYSPIELSLDGVGNLTERALQARYFSAASSTALGYGSWVGQDLGLVKYVGAAQSFVGTFLTALLLVTFTRRWMR